MFSTPTSSNPLERLPLKDLANTKSVSSSWKHAADSVNSFIRKAPWLTLPSKKMKNSSGCCTSGFCRFKNIEESIIYTMNKETSAMLLNFPCIGSSLGWLILFDVSTFRPLLFNPFSEKQIANIPSLKSLFDITKIDDDLDKDSIRSRMIPKAILTADPELHDDYSIVLIYIDRAIYNKIGFFHKGDESWTELSSIRLNEYEDIICFNNKLYAITNYYSIHTWDLQNISPKNRTAIELSFLNQQDFSEYDSCKFKRYLVESEGEILLVERLISEEMDDIVHTTKLFSVYKLNSDNKWVEVDSLGDRSLFLGGNHSVSVSTEGFRTCRRNSIYFTDD